MFVKIGNAPADWKPLATVGPGVRELRIRDETGAFRVIHMIALADAVLALDAFQKKTQQTSQRDLDLAIRCLNAWRNTVMEGTFRKDFDTPAEAANMAMGSELLSALIAQVTSWRLPQEAAAARLAVTRPRLNDLLRGKIDEFSLDALANLAGAAGLILKVKIDKAA